MFPNGIQCTIIKCNHNSVPLHHPGPTSSANSLSQCNPSPILWRPQYLTHFWTIRPLPLAIQIPHIRLCGYPYSHQMFPQIRYEIPLQVTNTLHTPLLQRSVALNATVILGYLLLGIFRILFRLPGHLMCWITFPENSIFKFCCFAVSSSMMVYDFLDLKFFLASCCDNSIRFSISSHRIFRSSIQFELGNMEYRVHSHVWGQIQFIGRGISFSRIVNGPQYNGPNFLLPPAATCNGRFLLDSKTSSATYNSSSLLFLSA